MKRAYVLLPMILVLAACGKATPPDTVESLVANPERLKEVAAPMPGRPREDGRCHLQRSE